MRVRAVSDEDLENLWKQELLRRVNGMLMPFGGMRTGLFQGQATIELTATGRYLLGLSEQFEWETDEADSGAIVVQADFEIVFLAPNPALEASLTRFSERIGQGLGALFRITRASIQAAASIGLSADEILGTLEAAIKTPLPPNVTRELKEWSAASVRLAWEPAQLLRCPDEETAVRILSASKGKLELVSPTILILTNSKQRSAITSACRKAGVFLDGPLEPKPKKKRKKKRRAWNW